MPQSPIRKLAPLAYEAQDRGVKIYRLNIGQPDLPTPQKALDVLKNIDRKTLEYSPSQGYRSLREALVGYYERYQIKLKPDEIIITAGGSEAVLFAFMSCLNPGDEIIVPEPAYANYMSFAISAGAVIRAVTTTIEEGFCLPKVEKFEELINERTKAILICNPNNPTGYLYTQKEMNRIRDLVKKYNLYLFSDEVYREFIYTGSPYISAMHLEGIEQNVVLIDSVSKRYSECGIRIGALITKNEAVRNTVMKFCFILGASQLVLACVINVVAKIRAKNLSFVADIGWLLDVLVIYMLVLFLVLNEEVNFGIIIAGVAAGFVLICLFGKQEPGVPFVKGMVKSLSDAFTVFLNTISCFGNVMSYIRLFAVGMASLAIADSFNSMAGGLLSGFALPAGILVLVLGHGLNLIMGLLSVVVHGVRLNLLEFSNQLGMEWNGYSYDPFRETAIK